MSERARGRALGHAEARELVAWLANGSLGESERAAAEAHLELCAECRQELELCRLLQADARRAEERAPAPHPVQLERLLARLDGPEADTEPAAAPAVRPGAWASWPRSARWTVAAQLAALLLVAVLAGMALAALPAPAPGFRTLAAPDLSDPLSAGALRLRVVFDPGLSEAALRALLQEVGAEIVAGPSPLGVYTLAFDRRGAEVEPTGWLIEHLRGLPGVRFVEPAAGGAP